MKAKQLKNLIAEEIRDVINSKNLTESELEQQYDDCFIIDIVSGGYDISCGGKFVTHVSEIDDALQVVKDWQEENDFYPSIWYVDDHGGATLIEEQQVSESEDSTTNKKRYIVTLSMYMYAKDDSSIKNKAEKFVTAINQKYDNRASIDSIYEQPFGKLTNRKIFGE